MTRLFGRASLVVLIILSACSAEATGSPSGASSSSGPSPTETAPTATPSASPSPEPSEPQTGSSDFTWTEAGRFADDGRTQLVADVTAWSGGFMAVGNIWPQEAIVGTSQPRIWTSPDGGAWTATRPRLGSTDVELRGILRLSTGGVIIVGRVPADTTGSTFQAVAWSSLDGEQWQPVELQAEMAGPTIDLGTGPVGHVISTGRALWYSPEGVRWQRVHRTPALGVPGAGDEGFVAPTSQGNASGAPNIFASGDGLTWVEGAPPASIAGAAAWRGDWLGWAYTENPTTISILHSADGLDWAVDFDVNDLTPADGPKAGPGLESQITQVTMSGEGGVVAMTLGWNHCCAMPPQGQRRLPVDRCRDLDFGRAAGGHLRDVPCHRWRCGRDGGPLRSWEGRCLLGRRPGRLMCGKPEPREQRR